VFCESEGDISACLRWSKKWNLDLAIAGGRHSFHAASSTNGLVIGMSPQRKFKCYVTLLNGLDLRKMNKVTVDRVGMKVSAQGGCFAEQVEVPAEAEGLSVVMGNVNDTGKPTSWLQPF
jgi:FAD/FMN-containing dehydrogenase